MRIRAGPRRPSVEAYQWYPVWLGGREAGHVQASRGQQRRPISRARRNRRFFHLRGHGTELDQPALRIKIQGDHSGVGRRRIVGGNDGNAAVAGTPGLEVLRTLAIPEIDEWRLTFRS